MSSHKNHYIHALGGAFNKVSPMLANIKMLQIIINLFAMKGILTSVVRSNSSQYKLIFISIEPALLGAWL